LCLQKFIVMRNVPDTMGGVVIGGILLLGIIVDELLRRRRGTQR
jgi:ribose/xylose/arabinose/galactoside ABC-type transport system permease subunit